MWLRKLGKLVNHQPSTSAPPLDAPAWAVKKQSEGTFVPYFCVTIFLPYAEPIRDVTTAVVNATA